MRYSYECWPNQRSELAEDQVTANVGVLSEPEWVIPPSLVPEDEDLKVLSEALPFDLEEGLQAYRHYQNFPQAGLGTPTVLSAEEEHWQDFARLVADHVLTYMLDHSLQAELDTLRSQNNRYHQDSLQMTEQVRLLVAENAELRLALGKAEHELAQFAPVAGGFFKKGN